MECFTCNMAAEYYLLNRSFVSSEDHIESLLLSGAKTLGLPLTASQAEQLFRFQELVLLWNEAFTLTAINTPRDFVIKHLLDSLALLSYLPAAPVIMDVGSGAGFPGVVLAVMLPLSRIFLIEPSSTKADFLSQTAKTLRLSQVEVFCARLKAGQVLHLPAAPNFIVSRAAFHLPDFLNLIIPYMTQGSLACAMKGPEYKTELEAARPLLARLKLHPRSPAAFTLPGSNFRRTLLFFKA